MDTDVFMFYHVFICVMSVLGSNYLAKMTSIFLMSNGVIVSHSNDETDFYHVFSDVNVKLGTATTCEIFFQDAKIPYQYGIISFPKLKFSHVY